MTATEPLVAPDLPTGPTPPGPVRFGASLPNHVPVAENLAQARLIEELGYDEVWTNENAHFRGIFTNAALIAAHTTRLGIGLGIVNPFHRHPSAIAMEAATLDEASGGRLRLGIGAALWNLRNLGEADARTARPLTATVEAITIIRALLRGEPVGRSSVFTISPEARLDFQPLRRDLPVYAGAVNAKMLHASGQVADAVELGAIASVPYVRWSIDAVHAGARSAGRDPAELDIAAPLYVSVHRDPTVARDAVRQRLAFYLNRVEPVVREHSDADPELVRRTVADIAEHGIEDGATRIPTEVIDAFTIAGDPEHVGRRLQQYADAGVRGLILQSPGGPGRADELRLFAAEVMEHVG